MGNASKSTIRSYTGPRHDVAGMIQESPRRVLDVGCSDGSLGAALLEVYEGAEVHGIEFDEAFAKIARQRLNSVLQADLNTLDVSRLPQDVDLLIFADVLEHTMQPGDILKAIFRHCATDDAYVIVSVPNVQHLTVIRNLLLGVWPQRDRGIFDRTHLRWFTLQSIRDLASSADLEIVQIRRKYRLRDESGGKLNRYAKWFARSPIKNFVTYQYVVLMKRRMG